MAASSQSATKAARRTVRQIAILFSYTLMLIGALALVYAGYVVEEARLYQERADRAFESMRLIPPEAPAQSSPVSASDTTVSDTPVTGRTISDAPNFVTAKGDVARTLPVGIIGRLSVPRIGLTVMLAEGDSNAVLRRAVGHLSYSPLPGQLGNVVFAGHRDTFFRPLRNIRAGDLITIETIEGLYEYKVEWFRVMPPDNVSVLAPSQSSELTLITCFPFDFVGSAPDRFVVRATEIGSDGRSLNTERFR
jgi:sortase A